MKRIKRVVLSLVLLLCLIAGSVNASAADERLGEIVDYSLLTDDSEAGLADYPVPFGINLCSGSGHITIAGTRKVTVAGSTTAYRTCDKVRVTLFLQRLEGNSWVTVKVLGGKTATNAYYVSNSATYSVTGGYYYRVSGGHTAIKGSTTESSTSYTNGIWVN